MNSCFEILYSLVVSAMETQLLLLVSLHVIVNIHEYCLYMILFIYRWLGSFCCWSDPPIQYQQRWVDYPWTDEGGSELSWSQHHWLWWGWEWLSVNKTCRQDNIQHNYMHILKLHILSIYISVKHTSVTIRFGYFQFQSKF